MSREKLYEAGHASVDKSKASRITIEQSDEVIINTNLKLLKEGSSLFVTTFRQEREDSGSGLAKLFGGIEFDALCIRTLSDYEITLEVNDLENVTINYKSPGGKVGAVSSPLLSESIINYLFMALDRDTDGGLDRLLDSISNPGGNPSYSGLEEVMVIQKVFIADGEKPELRKIPMVVTRKFIDTWIKKGFDYTGMSKDQIKSEQVSRFKYLKGE